MHVAIVLLLCSAVVHIGVSQSFPTVLPRTETVAPTTQKCSLEDQVAYISSLPNAVVCGPSLGTVFLPPANDTTALADALKDVCTNDCGGVYANYLQTTCEDEVAAESLRIYCIPTNGSAAAGPYCRYATGDFVSPSLFNNLLLCHESEPCSPRCRRALLNFKAEVGCCFQNAYNNTLYNQQAFDAGFITPSEFADIQKLNDPVNSPWSRCEVEPPQKCRTPPFRPPKPPRCLLEDQVAFISSLPNAAVCGPSLETVFFPPANDTMTLADALKDVCTNDCGGVYANYLKTACEDEVAAESLRIYCTPTNGSAAAGPYCRYATGDFVSPSLFNNLLLCNESEPCSPRCRRALLNFKAEVGCCFQNAYNNTLYNQQAFDAGFITPSEFADIQKLNDPVNSPWSQCEVEPPQKCRTPPFRPPAPPRCFLEDQVAFVTSLPNAAVCGPSLETVFFPPANNNTAVSNALANTCTDDCAGVYSTFLKSACNDQLGAESLRIFCTPTNGSAAAGNFCRFSTVDILKSSVINDLYLCDNVTTDSPCTPGCKAAILELKAQVGCCFQDVFNNSVYNRQLLNAGFLTPSDFTGLQKLNDPSISPWNLCEIEPPKKCGAPSFKPPESKCTLEDQIAFISSLPNSAVCGASIAASFTLTTTNSTALNNALVNLCTDDCEGVYTNYLRETCNDQLAAESFRLHCVPTNGASVAGPYCRFASEVDISYFDDFPCINSSSGTYCAPRCRASLLRIKAELGCCYQELYNNTFYSRQQVLAGFVTPVVFTEFQLLNNPLTNPWKVCNVSEPRRCPQQPPLEGCPRGTYRRNSICERCPPNTNISLSGGNATMCPCLRGFFRTSREGPSERCSAPPSACHNIQLLQRTDTQIMLRWAKPVNTGRNDYYYQIEYSDGETTGQHSLTSRMDYVLEVITGLKPDTNYKFTITVNNGVSDQDTRNEYLRRCELTTTTMEGRSSPPRDVQAFCSAIGWRMPRDPNGRIIGYDVHLNRLGAMISISGNDATFVAVEKEYQQIGTMVQVRARTSAGVGNWSQLMPLGCEEMSTITCPPCDCTTTSQPPQGIHFIIGGQIYGNNSIVSVASIGEGEENALICRTDRIDCCGTVPNRYGQFYYPNGIQVPINNGGQGFYRNRGDQVIRLNRREGVASPTGKFRCEIPDASGENQNIYITLVT